MSLPSIAPADAEEPVHGLNLLYRRFRPVVRHSPRRVFAGLAGWLSGHTAEAETRYLQIPVAAVVRADGTADIMPRTVLDELEKIGRHLRRAGIRLVEPPNVLLDPDTSDASSPIARWRSTTVCSRRSPMRPTPASRRRRPAAISSRTGGTPPGRAWRCRRHRRAVWLGGRSVSNRAVIGAQRTLDALARIGGRYLVTPGPGTTGDWVAAFSH